jgi:hypothetical protein
MYSGNTDEQLIATIDALNDYYRNGDSPRRIHGTLLSICPG